MMKTIYELLSSFRELDIHLWLENSQLRFDAPPGAMTEERMALLRHHKQEIIAFLQQATAWSSSRILPAPPDVERPLSFAQQRLWFLEQLEGPNPAYNMPEALYLTGQLDIAALDASFREVLQRHEVLRTSLPGVDGKAMLQVEPVPDNLFKLWDFSDLDDAELMHKVEEAAYADGLRPFNLANGPLIRLTLLKLRPDRHVLLINMHHIVADGWSVGVLIDELAALYDAFHQSKPSPLPPLPIQYADFAYWQRQWLTGETLDRQLTYWKNQLAGTPALLELPTDRPRPVVQQIEGRTYSYTLPPSLHADLQAFSRREGVTLFMTLLAAFKLLLHRYSQQTDIVVGSPIANRNRQEIEPLIGFFVNTQVLRTDLSGDPTFTELLHRVQQTTLSAYSHQDIPFERLVEALQPTRDLAYTPLFQVMFILQNAPVGRKALSGLIIEPLTIERGTSNFDMTLSMQETERGLEVELEYSTVLFNETTIQRLTQWYERLLTAVITNPSRPISTYSSLSAVEKDQILFAWNQTTQPFPETLCVHQLFEKQAAQTPDLPAVIFDGQHLTYRQLDERANQLAHYLLAQQIVVETPIGLCVDKSLEMIVGILGILKAGGAYVPLDPQLPSNRLGHIIKDTQLPLILTQTSLQDRLPLDGPPAFYLDRQWPELAELPTVSPTTDASPQTLVYLIYTSGSTGSPKAVMVTHRSLVNYATMAARDYALQTGDRLLQFASISWDTCAEEIFPCLTSGATLVLRLPNMLDSFAHFLSVCAKQQLTVLNLPTAFWHELTASFAHEQVAFPATVRLVIIGGEKALWGRLAAWQKVIEPHVRLVNTYGLSEATAVSTLCELNTLPATTLDTQEIPIGRPIGNVTTYILDANQQPVPVGVYGELHVGGAGLARGYLNQPALTAEKFIQNPFIPNTRLYRTGDLARYLPNGQIVFRGRTDHQVKIRGFRIEPGEIETVLSQHASVQETAVIALPHHDELQLTAFVAADAVDADTLRAYLQMHLPHYMVPATFIILDKLPKTPTGKLDRKLLPAPDFSASSNTFVPPKTANQKQMAHIWANVLHLEKVGIYDNFFELGGHSLLATQVMSRIRKTFAVTLPLRNLFEYPTIAGLSGQVENAKLQNPPRKELLPLQPISREQDLPLSFAQKRLWFIDQLEDDGTIYHMPFALRLTGNLKIDALKDAVNHIIWRHESLRTVFVPGANGEPQQKILPSLEISLPVTDLRQFSATAQTEQVGIYANAEAKRPFDLQVGPLLRMQLLQLNEDSHILLVAMHHIISDGWSLGVMMRELSILYQDFAARQLPSLPPLEIQYADFAFWQNQWLAGPILQEQLAYWQRQLAGAPPVLALPTDYPRPAVQEFDGDILDFKLDADLTAQLITLGQQSGVSLFMTMFAAFTAVLYRYTGQSDMVIGSPIANRNYLELEPLIGVFVNTLLLRIKFARDMTFAALLQAVKQMTLDAYAYQDTPFEKLVEMLQPERNLNHHPLFQVLFILQNAPETIYELPGLKIESLTVETMATFDLALSLEETSSSLTGLWVYKTNLFRSETIARLQAHLVNFLQAVVANPEQLIMRVPLLTALEKEQLLVKWNQITQNLGPHQPLHKLFEQQAQQRPDAPALLLADQTMTYGDLNARANQLAHYLRSLGVGPEVNVGICVERSFELVIGLLAILKAGGAYVPLDPAYPDERLAYIAADANLNVILVQQSLQDRVPQEHTTPVPLDALDDELTAYSTNNPRSQTRAEHLAYIIYTSGSTGKPKGTLISHLNVARLFAATQDWFQFDQTDVWTFFHAYAFDFSVWELWGALLYGGQLVIVPYWVSRAPKRFYDLLIEKQVTILNQTPSAFYQLMRVDEAREQVAELRLRKVIFGGEALELQNLRPWFERYGDQDPELINMYGITETTVHVTYRPIRFADVGACSGSMIGQAIPDLQIYILDEQQQLAPIGVPGEMYIGGDGVGRGYLHRPGLTATRFVPHPFSKTPGERLYRSGDLARYRENGDIEYLGRVDHQVKIRGFRIELGEIEAVLTQHEAVKETAVLVLEDDEENKRLVAYIVPANDESPSVSELRQHAQKTLPDYMVPAACVLLEKMPLTVNGKLDRRALPLPDTVRPDLLTTYVAPRNFVETELAQMWCTLLNVEQVGIHDNFFELGGHSLLLVQLGTHIQEAFMVTLPLRVLFDTPTIEALSIAITEQLIEEESDGDITEMLAELESLSPEELAMLLAEPGD